MPEGAWCWWCDNTEWTIWDASANFFIPCKCLFLSSLSFDRGACVNSSYFYELVTSVDSWYMLCEELLTHASCSLAVYWMSLHCPPGQLSAFVVFHLVFQLRCLSSDCIFSLIVCFYIFSILIVWHSFIWNSTQFFNSFYILTYKYIGRLMALIIWWSPRETTALLRP
jgi:hypothetical protein